jgi:hypothetical protein
MPMRVRVGAIVIVAVAALSACGAEETTSTNAPVVTTPEVTAERATATRSTADTTATEIVTTSPASTRPISPASPSPAIATSAFEAWRSGDTGHFEFIADPAVADFVSVELLQPDGWTGPTCEGAGGGTYCSWVSSEATVVLWLAYQLGGAKVMGVRLAPPPGGVAVWPFTTSEEAENTQQSVDAGHSPWQLDPAAVAMSYAENVLKLEQPQLQQTPLNVRITGASGVSINMHLVQPAQQGDGGIWAIKDVYANGIPG